VPRAGAGLPADEHEVSSGVDRRQALGQGRELGVAFEERH
jgi:hypothetical protein